MLLLKGGGAFRPAGRLSGAAVQDLDSAEDSFGEPMPELLLYRIDALSHLYHLPIQEGYPHF